MTQGKFFTIMMFLAAVAALLISCEGCRNMKIP